MDNNDFTLGQYSKAIGAGSISYAPLKDIQGNSRPNPSGSNPDIGAYESSLGTPIPKPTLVTVNQNGSGLFNSIEEAISFASDGDTILVGAGIYYENIEIMDKDIQIASLYLTSGDTSYISSTIIDGSQHSPLKSTVTVGSSISQSVNNVKLTGLTITGGGFTNTNVSYGAGIRARYLQSLECNALLVKNNSSYYGGGLSMEYVDRVIIRNSRIQDNTARDGGGVALWPSSSKLFIENTIISGNSAYENDGGGMRLENPDTTMIINSTIAYNTVPPGRYGAGIDFNTQWDDQILIMNSIITGNKRNGEEVSTQLGHVNGSFSSLNSLYGSNWDSFTPSSSSNDLIYPTGADPFVDHEGNNFQLSDYSSAIGSGIQTMVWVSGQVINAPSSDIFGNNRPNPLNSNPDMGAIESDRSIRRNLTYTVEQDGTGDFSTISEAILSLQISLYTWRHNSCFSRDVYLKYIN